MHLAEGSQTLQTGPHSFLSRSRADITLNITIPRNFLTCRLKTRFSQLLYNLRNNYIFADSRSRCECLFALWAAVGIALTVLLIPVPTDADFTVTMSTWYRDWVIQQIETD